jgi:hypothetical protein
MIPEALLAHLAPVGCSTSAAVDTLQDVRIKGDELKITPLKAATPEEAETLADRLYRMMPNHAAPRGVPRSPACPRANPHRRPGAKDCRRSQLRNFTSATSSGRTQCTRLSTKGDPKRLLRSGRHLERHLVDGKRLQAAPEAFELFLFDAGAGAAGIDEPPVGIVVGEQQAPRWTRAFGIGPSNHHEFLAVQAFNLDP